MMGTAISRALEQMWDPTFRKVLLWTLALTILLFIALGIGVDFLIDRIPESETGWINSVADASAWVMFAIVGWFLFPAAATAIMGLFLDDVAAAVEAKYYPADPPGKELGIATAIWEAVKLGVVIVLINIAALPLYIIAFFIPLLGPLFVYYLINGYLLGREYFELAGLRHGPPAAVKALRRQSRAGMVIYGLPIAFAFSIPFLNLLAPLFGTAYMVHVFKAMSRR